MDVRTAMRDCLSSVSNSNKIAAVPSSTVRRFFLCCPVQRGDYLCPVLYSEEIFFLSCPVQQENCFSAVPYSRMIVSVLSRTAGRSFMFCPLHCTLYSKEIIYVVSNMA